MLIINWAKVIPVVVSIIIIIAIAILREYSRTFAAIVAVMPINVPLGMWILVAGEADSQAALAEFTNALLINIIPTLLFLIAAWQMAKAGHGVLATIVVGYLVWGICLALIMGLQAIF